MLQRLMIFILIIAAIIVAAVNLYWSWGEGPPPVGVCYAKERFVLPDVCVGTCEKGELCKPLSTRGYLFGLLEQPYECVCVERGKDPKKVMETGTGVTGVVVPPTF